MSTLKFVCAAVSVLAAAGTAPAFAGETTANAGITNNYLWRGLTQSQNAAAISGGIDFAADNGFYVGTWASNVSYAPADNYSFEHDIYFGVAGGEKVTWDVGWLYYNYDDAANIDFHDVYAKIGVGGFGAAAFILGGTEADEPAPGVDFGFGEAYYLSLDYGWELENGIGLALHAGRHSGDFNDFFNFGEGDPTTDFDYTDYAFSMAVKDFTFTVSDTDLDETGPADPLQNDDMKFVVSYKMSFGL